MPISTRDGPGQRDVIHIVDDNLRKGFAQVPRPVLKAKGLSVKAKLVYVLLLDYAWRDDSCFPGQPTMAADLDVSVDSVQRALQELKGYQLVDWKQQGLNRPNVYYILRLSDCPQLGLSHAGNRKLRLPETATLRLPETADCGPNNTQETIRSISNTGPPSAETLSEDTSKFRKGSRPELVEEERGETAQSEPAPVATSQGLDRMRAVLTTKGLLAPEPAPPPTKQRSQRPASSPTPTNAPVASTATEAATAAVLDSPAPTPRRRRRTNVTPDEQQAIQVYLGDFAPELGDQAPFQSSVSRVCNTYAASGLTLSAFIQRLYSARSRTKERLPSIRSPQRRFAYFLALVEEECGLRAPPETSTRTATQAGTKPAPVAPPQERKSLAGRYSHLVHK